DMYTLHPVSYVLNVSLCRRPPPSSKFPFTTLLRSRARVVRSVWCVSTGRAPARRGGGRPVQLAGLSTFDVSGVADGTATPLTSRSEEHTSELHSRFDLVCRLLLAKKKTNK